MTKLRKYIFIILFFGFVTLFGMTNKASALKFQNKEVKIKEKFTITYSDMTKSNNLYCVAHQKASPSANPNEIQQADYTVRSYVEIDGRKSSFNGGNIRYNDNNAVLAAILGGVLTQGYGADRAPTDAQGALHMFWNKWVESVGKDYNFFKYAENDSRVEFGLALSKAIVASKKTDYHVKIYYMTTGNDNMQQMILVETFAVNPPSPNVPTPGQTEVEGTVNISGFVWEDVANSKANNINSQYEEGDLRVEGIKVHWKDNNGKEIASTTTGKDGSYKLSTTLALYNHPYGIKDTQKYDQINNSYIEFEYNGLKYTTVAYKGELSSANTSKGKENADNRTALDEKFDRVENQAVYDGDQAIITGLPNTKISDANYTPELAVSASTSNIIRNLMKTAETNKWTETKEFCTDHCQVGEGPHLVKRVSISGKKSTVDLYCDGSVNLNVAEVEVFWKDPNVKDDPGKIIKVREDLSDKVTEISNIMNNLKEIKGEEINKAGIAHYYPADEINGPTHRDCLKGEYKIYVWNINNMNLGLVHREQPDAAVVSDIEKVRVITKGNEYTYKYGNRGIDNEGIFDYKVNFADKYMQTYTRAVNPSDIAYSNYNNTNDIQVYVTYNIRIKNQSNTLTMKINNIVNYYDSDYTIFTGENSSTSTGWEDTGQTVQGKQKTFKVAYNPIDVTLQAQQEKQQTGQSDFMLKIEFEISQDKIKELQNNDSFEFTNYTEIVSFTTYYGDATICSERERADSETKKKSGMQYAGLDSDSTPGNAKPEYEETYEDDTDRAPSFLLKKDSNNRQLSGIVYEDTQTEESKNKNERLGNGKKDENEKGVKNVQVELINPETGQTADLYKMQRKDDTTTENDINKSPAITYSDKEGNYSFEGVVVDKYIIKYTYGNGDDIKTIIDTNEETEDDNQAEGEYINARNYKSTIITDPKVKSVMDGEESTDWYLYVENNSSIAVDDIEERLQQESLKNSTYKNTNNMSAYSKEFQISVEYTTNKESEILNKDIEDGTSGEFTNNWSNFNFGIIERPREDIVINKTINKFRLTLSNEQILVEGDPRQKATLDFTKILGIEKREKAEFRQIDASKQLSIEVDQELLQGCRLEIWYGVTFTNNSENDYDYTTNTDYYYYGTNKQGDPLCVADLVVDYINSSMVCDVGDDFDTENADGIDNKEWTKYDNGVSTDAEYLKNNGYISVKKEYKDVDQTYETIKNENLQCILTRTFANVKPGDTKTSVLYASQVLSNKDEEYNYENHVEIIELNSKTGRTIKNVENNTRKQVAKSYEPGDYIPNLSKASAEHEQDDDNVRVIITPPTGIKNYFTIYEIIAVIGLSSVSVIIIFIKKRLKNK